MGFAELSKKSRPGKVHGNPKTTTTSGRHWQTDFRDQNKDGGKNMLIKFLNKMTRYFQRKLYASSLFELLFLKKAKTGKFDDVSL